MKIFQIVDGFCHWDATEQLKSLSYAQSNFPPTDLFVEAPDYVFEGWGFDPACVGDARFIKPEPPEGWAYDEKNGTLYPTSGEAAEHLADPSGIDVWDELAAAYREGVETA